LIDREAGLPSWAGMSFDDDDDDSEWRRQGNETSRPSRSLVLPRSSSSSLSTTASSSGRISGSRGHREEPPQAQPPSKPPFFFCSRKSLRKAVACAVIVAALVLQQKQAQSLSRTLSQAMAGATNAEAPQRANQTMDDNVTHHFPSSYSSSSSSSVRLVESLLADGLTRCVNQGGTAGGTWVSRRSRNCTSKDDEDLTVDMGRDSTNASSSNHDAVDHADRSNSRGGVNVRASASASEEAIPPPAAAAAAASSILAEHAVIQIPALLLHRGNHSLLKRFHNKKVPVVVWPLCETGIGNAVSMHLQTNGIQESPYLELSHDLHNFHPHVVWIGDAGSGARSRTWCTHFYDRVYNATMRRKELGLNTSWPIYIIDYTDYSSRQRCHNVEQLVGPEFVSYSKRSVVRGRRWKNKSSWVEVGRIANLWDDNGNVTYRHTPFIVRTDTIESLQGALRERGLALHDPIERLDRPVDVTHLWPRSSSRSNGGANAGAPGADAMAAAQTDRGGVGEVESHLRTLVSDEIWRYTNDAKLRNWTVLVGLAGSPTRVGRQSVASAYLDAMLSTKIMVVTQRDGWEDHYRLFEALVSGALVMTDQMLSLPSGLQNGTSLVEFGSLRELMSLLDYYLIHQDERLQIATEGRRVAMLRHRSWHRIEEVIFGRPLTLCEERGNRGPNQSSADCPYVVHANQSIQVS
jgi:Glycosyl transferases group 1